MKTGASENSENKIHVTLFLKYLLFFFICFGCVSYIMSGAQRPEEDTGFLELELQEGMNLHVGGAKNNKFS